MSSDHAAGDRAATTCSRCGSHSANAFGFNGLCLRCAGVRVLQMESGTPWPTEPEVSGKPLEQIGPYEIIEELGRGGMGRVYAARQVLLGRIVALKTLREGVNPELDLRFLREIQTVARLRHPSIVAIHDSGRANGSVYFSMDYIEGGDLSARLKADPLTPKEAALMMSKIADALAYAHGEGILHRDLKPSNILLDGTEPKLADFGLAAEIQAGGDLTAITHVLGTPHYLSPEAMQGGSAKQTVASDIYSAGVVLFEMLSGRTPFAGASAAELPAIAQDSDPPSLRLLSPVVPKDLETICLKCLDRDPLRRYAAAAELADDLRRFLGGEPIRAQPASVLYRFKKFARRHRLILACLSLCAVILVAATIVSLLLASRAREAERLSAADSAKNKILAQRAQKAEQASAADTATANAVITFLARDVLAQAQPDEQPNRAITLKEVIDGAAAKVGTSFKDHPDAELSVRETLAETYDRLGDYQAEKPQLARAIELRKAGSRPNDGEGLITDMDQEALLMANTNQRAEAKTLLEDVIRISTATFGPHHLHTLHARTDLIYVLQVSGDVAAAEKLSAEMVGLNEQYLGPDAGETITAESDLSSMYFWEGKLPEAEAINLKTVAAFKRTSGPEKPDTLTAMANLAAVYWAEDKPQQAEAMDIELEKIRSRLLGPDHPETLRTLNSLGAAYREDGKLDLAVTTNTRSYEGRLKTLGPDSPDTLASKTNLALAKMEAGDLPAADRLATECLASCQRLLGPEHFATLGALSALAEIDRRLGRLEASEKLRTELLRVRTKKGGKDSLNALIAATGLGEIQIERGEFVLAESLLNSLLPGWKKLNNAWRLALCQNLHGAALAGAGHFAEAEPLMLASIEALEHQRSSLPPLELRLIRESEERLATAYRAVGRTAQADAWTRKAQAKSP